MDKKDDNKNTKKEKDQQPKQLENVDELGFPEDIDFKRFLGCGG